MSLRRWFIVPVVALFALLAFGSSGSFAADTSTTETVKVLKMNEYLIQKRGDTLWYLAGRFGVSMEDILKANPQVAKRTGKRTECGPRYGLCLGERVLVPTYVAKERIAENVGNDELVAVPWGMVNGKSAENAQLKEQLAKAHEDLKAAQTAKDDLQKKYNGMQTGAWFLLSVLAFLLGCAMLGWIRSDRLRECEKHAKNSDERPKPVESSVGCPAPQAVAAFTTVTGEEKIAPVAPRKSRAKITAAEKLKRQITGTSVKDVEEALNSEAFRGPDKSPVLVKNVPRWARQHSYDVTLTIEQLQALVAQQKNDNEKKKECCKPTGTEGKCCG